MFKILHQMEKCICKIECNDGSFGTGFFCKIPQDNKTYINALITNNHVLKSNDILVDKHFTISLNDELISLIIYIDELRNTYTLEKPYDVTFIEIKKSDGISENSFLEIDDSLFEENELKNYKIYLLHYPNGKELQYSVGRIKSISLDSHNIIHSCETCEGSSGAPIINLNNNKVLGLHKGSRNNHNLGTFLKIPIEKFKKNKVFPKNNYPQFIKYDEPLQDVKNKLFVIRIEEKKSFGFFCNIPFKKLNTKLSVFITISHLFPSFFKNKEIQITSKILTKTIIINENRKFYMDKDNDIAIIEIKPSDNIYSNLFLEIDENIFFLNSKEMKNLVVYLLSINDLGTRSYFLGNIVRLNNNQIIISCSSNVGNCGSPILNLSNLKVFGIYSGERDKYSGNIIGTLIKSSIDKYIEICF